MRYSASEKLEIIRTVENSFLGIKRTLKQIGIPRSTFYSWYDRYLTDGLDRLEDIKPIPNKVWNLYFETIIILLILPEETTNEQTYT